MKNYVAIFFMLLIAASLVACIVAFTGNYMEKCEDTILSEKEGGVCGDFGSMHMLLYFIVIVHGVLMVLTIIFGSPEEEEEEEE